MRIRTAFMGHSYLSVRQFPDDLDVPGASQLDDALGALAQRLGTGQALPPTCLVVVSGRHVGTLASHRNCPLADGDELVLIAPVAGG